MKVIVKPYLYLREFLGWTELSLELPERASAGDLFRLLRREHGFPERIGAGRFSMVLFAGEEPVNMTVLVNGRPIRFLRGMETVLEEGAVVTLFPPAAGG